MFPITWPTSLPRKDPPAKPRLVVMLLSSVGLSVMQMLQHVDFDLHKGKFQVTSPYHLWRITNLSAIVCELCANGVSILYRHHRKEIFQMGNYITPSQNYPATELQCPRNTRNYGVRVISDHPRLFQACEYALTTQEEDQL
jgi:hypothetical protein